MSQLFKDETCRGRRAINQQGPSTPPSKSRPELGDRSSSFSYSLDAEDLFSSPSSTFSDATTSASSIYSSNELKGPCDNNHSTDIVQTYSTEPKYYDSTLISSITPASCLQCSLLGMPCDARQPTCSRCAHRHEQSYYGWHGMIEHFAPCLAQRKRTIEEMRLGVYAGEVDILFRLEEDGEGTWERKLELANEVSDTSATVLDLC